MNSMSREFDPGMAAYIEQLSQDSVYAAGHARTLEARRQSYLELSRTFARPYPAAVTARDEQLATKQAVIPVRLYHPVPVSSDLPAIVFFHGGGWIVGGIESHDSIAADICGATGAAVISVEYRLAPEHPFPAPFEDSYAAVCQVAAEAKRFGIDRARIAVCGDSAGGNLAAAVTLAARDRGAPNIVSQVLIYPVLGIDFDLPSYRQNENGPLLTRNAMIDFWNHYVAGGLSKSSCYAAPLLADTLAGLPPAYISTAEHDPVRDDGRVYADQLRAGGTPAEYRNAPRLVHGWLRARYVSSDAAQEFSVICRALRTRLGLASG